MAVYPYPFPQAACFGSQYRLYVNEIEIPTFDTQVVLDNTDPMRNVQRPLLSSYATFSADAGDTLCVRVEPLFAAVREVCVMPLSRRVSVRRKAGCIGFEMTAPDQLVVEINGLCDRVLMLFANPPQCDAPDPADPDVLYFAPGLHTVDDPEQVLRLGSGQTLYLAGGAIINGVIEARNAENVRIAGYGIIDSGKVIGRWHQNNRAKVGYPKDAPVRRSQLTLRHCKNIQIDGPLLVDSPGWTLAMFNCEQVAIHNTKLIGHQGNTDGIDICSSKQVRVENCFIRGSDDSIAIKSLYTETEDAVGTQDVLVRHTTVWADRASALEIGHEECAPSVSNIRFVDIDILNQREETYGYHAIDITNVDYADIHDVLFEDIRVERCARLLGLRIREGHYSRGGRNGQVRDITLRNIRCDGNPTIFLSGRDAEHQVSGIRLENITVHGEPLRTLSGVYRNPYVRDVTLLHEGRQVDTLRPLPAADACVPLSIEPMCNITLGRDMGICGLASEAWMRMPGGTQLLEGIPFTVCGAGYDDEGTGDYKRAAVPPERRGLSMPSRLAVGACTRWLFFLHTAVNVASPIGGMLCRYRVTYVDGVAHTIPVRNQNDAHDWRCWSLAGWQPVFEDIRLYIMPWENTRPDVQIESIELLGGDIPELPVLFAITYAK